jgi:integrase
MRQGEIFSLRWFDVDFGRGLINVRNTKTGKDRSVPMNSVVRELLESLPKASGFVFPSPRTKERLVSVKKSSEAARTAAKLSDFRFHDLRHTAATRLGSAGVDAFTLCSIFGWSDVRVALRYTHAVSKAHHEAVEKLAETPTSGDESVTKEIQPPGTAAVSG